MTRDNKKFLIKGSCVLFFVMLLIFITKNFAWAEETALNSGTMVYDTFKTTLSGSNLVSSLSKYGKSLFGLLVTLQITWNVTKLIIDGKFDLQALLLMVLKEAIVIGFFWYITQNGVTLFNKVIDGFRDTGTSLAGAGSIEPLNIISNGINLIKDMWKTVFPSSRKLIADLGQVIIDAIMLLVVSMFVLYSVAQIALTAAVTYLRAIVSSTILVYFLGFSGCEFTRDIAIASIKTVFMQAVELFTVIILLGVINKVFPALIDNMNGSANSDSTISVAFGIAIAAFIMQGLVSSLPSMISGVITGAGQGSGGSNAAMGQQLASLMAGAATMAGGMALTGAGAAAGKAGSFGWGKLTNAISNRFGGNNEVTSGGSQNTDNKSDGGKGLVDFANSQEKGGGSIAYKAAKTSAGIANKGVTGAGKAAVGSVKGAGNFFQDVGKRMMQGENAGSAIAGAAGTSIQNLGYAAKGMFAKKSSSGEIEAGDNTPPPPSPQNEPFKEGTSNDLEVEKKDGGSADTTKNSSQETQGTADTAQKEVEVNPQNVTTQETTETTTKTTTRTETTEKIEKEGTTETTEK